MWKKEKRDTYNGTLLLYKCKVISTTLPDTPELMDYILDDYQFSDRMAEFYKGYYTSVATEDRGVHHDCDNLVDAITIAVMPFTLDNINVICRELAISRSSNFEHLLQHITFSHIGSYFVVEYPFLLRLSDLIDIVKKENKDYQVTGCIPQQPMVKIIYGVLNGLNELHQMNLWHSKLDSNSICLTVHHPKILIANFADSKPSKCKNDDDGPLENYMAPEQLIYSKRAAGKLPNHVLGRCIVPQATEKADIWALGMIVYEMVVGKSIYKKEFEQSNHHRNFVDKILYMQFPSLADMYPFQYTPLIDKFLSFCVKRDISERPCACELLENFHGLFMKFDSDENVILEVLDDSRSVLASFSPNSIEKWGCQVADEPADAKLAIPRELMDPKERLKWKRFDKSKIKNLRSGSLSFGDCHLMIKVRKESLFLSRFNPFVFVQTTLPPYNTRAISYIEEAIFQLVKKQLIDKYQALTICSVISQLTEFNLLDEGSAANEYVVSETLNIDQHHSMQKVFIPLVPMSRYDMICDSKTLYQSILLEYVFPQK